MEIQSLIILSEGSLLAEGKLTPCRCEPVVNISSWILHFWKQSYLQPPLKLPSLSSSLEVCFGSMNTFWEIYVATCLLYRLAESPSRVGRRQSIVSVWNH